jgi:serine/threonine-protein kinase
MITESGQVKVMDFGIARLSTSHTITQASTVFGTAAYLAPEQAQGQRVDGRADIYALGVVLYEMLAGQVPFVADSAVAVASKHVFEEPVPPSSIRPEVPPALEAATMRALAKDPADRFQDAAEMAASLDAATGRDAAAATTLPIAAPTGSPEHTAVLPAVTRRSHAAPPRRRQRWWIPVVVALVGLLLLAAFLPALLGGDQPKRGAGPKHTNRQQQTAPATSPPPATTAATSEPPATTEPPATSAPKEPLGVEDAAGLVLAVASEALDAGAIDDHTFKDIEHGLEEASKHYGEGDLDKALDDIAHTQDRVNEAVDHEKATPEAGAAINQALDRLATSMQASPPDDSSSGPDGGPGKDKGHDEEKD